MFIFMRNNKVRFRLHKVTMSSPYALLTFLFLGAISFGVSANSALTGSNRTPSSGACFLVTANAGNGSVTSFVEDEVSEGLKKIDTVADGSNVRSIVISSTGNSLFAAGTNFNGVRVYPIKGDNRVALPARGLVNSYEQSRAAGVLSAISRSGYFYVADRYSSTISEYYIDKKKTPVFVGNTYYPKDDALAPVTPNGNSSNWIHLSAPSIDPSGKYFYLSNWGGENVSEFKIGSAGHLLALKPFTVPAGTGPTAIAIDPKGRFAYVANFGSNNISQYKVGMDGQLKPLDPPTISSGENPTDLSVDQSGRYLYAVNFGSSNISEYKIGPFGRLVKLIPAVVGAGLSPTAIAVSAKDDRVYVTSFGDDDVSQYSVNAEGQLVARGRVSVAPGIGPWAIALGGACKQGGAKPMLVNKPEKKSLKKAKQNPLLSRQNFNGKSKLLGPAFSCAKAHNVTEKLICSDPELSQDDLRLSEGYQQLLLNIDDQRALRKSQRQWLKNVRNRCETVECLKTEYSIRMASIGLQLSKTISFSDASSLDHQFAPSEGKNTLLASRLKGRFALRGSRSGENGFCSAFTKNLNSFSNLNFDQCNPRLSSKLSKLDRPSWNEVPLNMYVARKIITSRNGVWGADWVRWLEITKEARRAQKVKMWSLNADLMRDGRYESLVKLDHVVGGDDKYCKSYDSAIFLNKSSDDGSLKYYYYFGGGFLGSDLVSYAEKYYFVLWRRHGSSSGWGRDFADIGAKSSVLVSSFVKEQDHTSFQRACWIDWVPK